MAVSILWIDTNIMNKPESSKNSKDSGLVPEAGIEELNVAEMG